MIISEKQLFHLLEIAYEFVELLRKDMPVCCKSINNLLREIKNQQSDELREVKE